VVEVLNGAVPFVHLTVATPGADGPAGPFTFSGNNRMTLRRERALTAKPGDVFANTADNKVWVAVEDPANRPTIIWKETGGTSGVVTTTATPAEEPVAGSGNDGDMFVNVTDDKMWARTGGNWVLVYDHATQFDAGSLFTNGRAMYNPADTYIAGEVVEYNHGFWVATGNVGANVTPDGTTPLWRQLALDRAAAGGTQVQVLTAAAYAALAAKDPATVYLVTP
jgi:hypothetical protein